MTKHLVEKKSDGKLESWNYGQVREDREDDMIIRLEPGKDFVLIEDTGSDEKARTEAEAYWDGTHERPERIDAWVKRAKDRKQELSPPSTSSM